MQAATLKDQCQCFKYESKCTNIVSAIVCVFVLFVLGRGSWEDVGKFQTMDQKQFMSLH